MIFAFCQGVAGMGAELLSSIDLAGIWRTVAGTTHGLSFPGLDRAWQSFLVDVASFSPPWSREMSSGQAVRTMGASPSSQPTVSPLLQEYFDNYVVSEKLPSFKIVLILTNKNL